MGSYYGSRSESCWGGGGGAIVAICAHHYQENTLRWPSSCSLTSMFKSLSPAGSAHVAFLSLSLSLSHTHRHTYPALTRHQTLFLLFTFCRHSIVSDSVLFTPPYFDSCFLTALTVARAHAANTLQLEITPLTATVLHPLIQSASKWTLSRCAASQEALLLRPHLSCHLSFYLLFYISIQLFLTSLSLWKLV